MIEPEAGLLPREIAEKNEKLWRVSIMTKTDLIAQVAANTEMSKKSAEAAVNAVFDALSKGMAEGEKITISGFGTFEVRERAERQGINPRTREAITIAASRNIVFKPAKALKDTLSTLLVAAGTSVPGGFLLPSQTASQPDSSLYRERDISLRPEGVFPQRGSPWQDGKV